MVPLIILPYTTYSYFQPVKQGTKLVKNCPATVTIVQNLFLNLKTYLLQDPDIVYLEKLLCGKLCLLGEFLEFYFLRLSRKPISVLT